MGLAQRRDTSTRRVASASGSRQVSGTVFKVTACGTTATNTQSTLVVRAHRLHELRVRSVIRHGSDVEERRGGIHQPRAVDGVELLHGGRAQARLREPFQLVRAHRGLESRVDHAGHPVAAGAASREQGEHTDQVVELLDGFRQEDTRLPAGGAEHLVVAGHRGRVARRGARPGLRAAALVGDDGLGGLHGRTRRMRGPPRIQAFQVHGDDARPPDPPRSAPAGPRPSRRTCCRSSRRSAAAGSSGACR